MSESIFDPVLNEDGTPIALSQCTNIRKRQGYQPRRCGSMVAQDAFRSDQCVGCGGKRCIEVVDGVNCGKKQAKLAGSTRCVKHGGGRHCQWVGCIKSVMRGATDFFVRLAATLKPGHSSQSQTCGL